MYHEAKKLLIQQRGFLMISVFLLIQIFVVCIKGYDSHFTIDIYEKEYEQYMDLYSGYLTEEKMREIEQEYYDIHHLDFNIKNNDEDYIKQLNKAEKKDIFTIIYARYKYAKENPSEHYMLDSRGWETLLCHDTEEYIFIISLLVLTALLFCTEYESGMDYILLTSRNGKYKTGRYKILMNVLLAILLMLLYEGIKYLYIRNTVGLPHGSYPLKSIQFFENTSYHISLNKAYILILCFRVFGAVYFSMFLSMLALLLKKKVGFLVVGSAGAILPSAIFSGKDTLYHLPIPIAYLKGSGFLWENKYSYRYNEEIENVKYCSFHSISQQELIVLIMVNILLMIILYGISMKLYSKDGLLRWIQKKKVQKKLLLIFVFFSLSSSIGCSTNRGKVNDDFIYNSNQKFDPIYYNGAKIWVMEDASSIMMQKEDEEEISLTRDIINENNGMIYSACVYGNSCYFMVISEENDSSIYKISLKDYHQELLYTTKEQNTEDYFGLKQEQIGDSEWYADVICEYTGFFVNSHYIYLVKNRSILQINRRWKTSKIILNDLGENIEFSYSKGNIYYVNMNGNICVFQESKNKTESWEVYGKDILVQEGYLLYTDLKNGHKEKRKEIIY